MIVLVDLGSIAWLVAGRNWAGSTAALPTRAIAARAFPSTTGPAGSGPSNPDDDEAFLRQLRERAEQQRRDYRTRREQELRAEREQLFGNRAEDDRPDPDGAND